MPILLVGTIIFAFTYNKEATFHFLKNEKEVLQPTDLLTSINQSEALRIKGALAVIDSVKFAKNDNDVETYLTSLNEKEYIKTLHKLQLKESVIYESGFDLFSHKIPLYIFFLISIALTILSITHNLSLIPMLGLVSCLYMMSELGVSNWIGFGIWLFVGLIVYFGYSRKNSKLEVKIDTRL